MTNEPDRWGKGCSFGMAAIPFTVVKLLAVAAWSTMANRKRGRVWRDPDGQA
jgi:hypothetical protein